MNYEINPNEKNVSSTVDTPKTTDEWTLDDVFNCPVSVDQFIDVLNVTDYLKKKYPYDDIVQCFEDIIRDEICMLFGGSINNNDEY